MQTHFDNPNFDKGIKDSSGVKFFLAPVDQPREMDYGVFQLGDPAVQMIGENVIGPYGMYTFECPDLKASKPITLFTHAMHMHGSGARMVTEHKRGGVKVGGSEIEHGARFSAEIYTRGCHWIPRMFA